MTKFDPYRKKTFTSYWNHFSLTPKKHQSTSIFIKKIKKIIKKIIPYRLKIQIHKNINVKNEIFFSFQNDTTIINYRNLLLSKAVKKYLDSFQLKYPKKNIIMYVEEYSKLFLKSPITDMNSGFGFNEGLFLFCLIKVTAPTLVIESGIMKGFTTYLIDAATDKKCLLKCYDISFENIQFKSKKAEYFNHDINRNPPDLKGHKVLAFWDDHTSQLDRLEFSIKNDVKFNIFDDDLGFLNFHSDGWPPIPSITMLYEVKKNIIKTPKINWVSRGRKGEMWINEFANNNAIDSVRNHKVFPNIFSLTGYKNHSECSFLILK